MAPGPGDSPFRVKGLVYQGARDFYAARLRGGPDAVGAALPAPLNSFWTQLFLASSSYDVLPLVDISHAAAGCAGVGHKDLVVENARWLARRDIRGVYRLLLRLASPSQVARRLPRVSMRYFDFGGSRIEDAGDTSLRAVQTGVPAPLVAWMMWVVEGFTSVALETAGAPASTVRLIDQVADGERAGIETRTLRWQLQW